MRSNDTALSRLPRGMTDAARAETFRCGATMVRVTRLRERRQGLVQAYPSSLCARHLAPV